MIYRINSVCRASIVIGRIAVLSFVLSACGDQSPSSVDPETSELGELDSESANELVEPDIENANEAVPEIVDTNPDIENSGNIPETDDTADLAEEIPENTEPDTTAEIIDSVEPIPERAESGTIIEPVNGGDEPEPTEIAEIELEPELEATQAEVVTVAIENIPTIAKQGRSANDSSLPLDGHCLAGEAPEDVIKIERLLSDYQFNMPTDATVVPGTAERSVFVIDKRGRLHFSPLRVDVAPAEVVQVRDFTVDTEGDGGLLGIALHPDYANNRRAFVTYTVEDEEGTKTLFLTEFNTGPNHIEWTDEKVIISYEQQSKLHHGGSLRFAPDGMLFMGFGDDGSYIPNDVRRLEAQDPTTMVGTIIRIDIDNTQDDLNYAIPADNPSINGMEVNEVYAYGFRNPWRMSFDSEPPHQLYVGDVGQFAFEEVNAVEAGGNYGWPECEGLCESSKTGFIDPIHEYDRADGRAVIGGVVYRGQTMPSLVGRYVYGDFLTKALYAIDVQTTSSNGSYPVDTVARTELAPSGFFTDENNEVYVFGSKTHGLYRLVENFDAGQSGPPSSLIDTGCFTSLADGNPVPNHWVQDYDINQQFWSDGAKKYRFLSLPEDTAIDISDPYNWQLPVGGVVFKHFRMNDKLFETRFFVRHDNGQHAGYTYYWNDDLTAANLVNSEGASRQFGDLTWRYPSRAQCMQCHTNDAGGTLALESAQLNLNREYEALHSIPGEQAETDSQADQPLYNQIDYLMVQDYLESEDELRLPAYPTIEQLSDSEISIDQRVLSYLHVNCSSCHRGERSVGRANWDARYITGFDEKELCNVVPLVGVHSVIEELVWPSSHQLSALWQRAVSRGSNYDMPPIGSELVDPMARVLLAEWIDGLTESCITQD